MDIYTAQYHWTREELARSLRNHYRFKINPILAIIVRIFLVFLSLVFIIFYLFLYDEPITIGDILSIIVFIGMGVLCLFPRQIGMFLFCRGFDEQPEANAIIEWKFSEEKINLRSNVGCSEVLWEAFIKVIETNEGFLFYHQKLIFHWLPYSSLQPETIEAIRRFCQVHQVEYIKRSR